MVDPVDTGPTAQPTGADHQAATAHQEDGGPEPSIGRIPALDGVRAIGIVLVLFFHGGFGWAGGGFFGVDVFFVLSGFLITGLLVSEFRQNAHIGLKRFWGHRVRRLVPALLAMMAGVAVYAVFFAPPDTLGQLRGDAVATLLYGNNWHQIASGQGYFAALDTPRPLLHTWSLSIEEQFYLVWPLVVLAVLHVTRSLRVLLTITVIGAVASAVEMAYLYGDGSGQSRVYYGTDTRAQALLIGAALAVLLAPPLARRSRGGRELPSTSLVRSFRFGAVARGSLVAVGGAGLAVVVWMSVTDNATTSWIYRGGFALLALATAAVIACVALVPASPWARALSVRPVRSIGAISYGLYLWHWPIFVFLDNARTGLVGWPLFGLRVGVSVAVAAASLRFLEMPIRRGALRGWRGWAATPLAVGGTAVILVASTAGAAPALTAQSASSTVSSSPAGQVGDPGTSANTPVVPAGTGGPIRALLVGDSEASFLGFGLGPDSGAHDVDYAGDGVFGCGLVQGTTLFHGTVVPQAEGERGGQVPVPCSTQLARWQADLDAFHPDVVLLSDGEYEVRDQLVDGKWTHLGEPGFDTAELRALQGAVSTLRSTGATVVLLTAVYYRQPEQADGEPWPEDDPRRVDEYNALLRKVATADGPGVVVEDLNAHLDPGGHYDQYIGGVNVRYADGIHVDAAGAKLVSPWLLSQVEALGTANRAASAPATTTTSAPS
ncbi:MAG: acyltransferase family protein [Acidimicrobiales bacterium]